MKKILSYILPGIALMMSVTVLSAQPRNRINATIIGDALNQLPAQDSALYVRLMKDIASTGEEGLGMLIEMLERGDAASIPAQYAIDGLCAYASADTFDAAGRELIIAAITKAASDEEPGSDLAGFYEKQLRRLGVLTAEEVIYPAVETQDVKKQAKALVTALRRGDRQQRFDAFNAISDPAPLYADVIKVLPKLSEEALTDAIWWLGEQKDPANGQAVLPYLASGNVSVLSSAAWALVKMDSAEGMQRTAEMLSSENPEVVAIAEQCLRSSRGPVSAEAAKAFLLARPAGRAAILGLIAQRRDFARQDLVINNLDSENAAVSDAAFKALKDVVRDCDLDRLYTILEKCDASRREAVCDAIIAAASKMTKAQQFAAFESKMNSVAEDGRDCYIPLLIRTADIEQLHVLCGQFSQSPEFFSSAFGTYLDAVNGSSLPGAQRLLLATRVMPMAQNDDQKNMVLNSVRASDEFLGIIYAGRYIDQPALEAAAAKAIEKTALAHPEYNGPEVTALLERTIKYLETAKPRDWDYSVTAIRKHIAGMPAGEGFVSMFDGKSLDGWKGLVENPIARRAMKAKDLEKAQKEADARMNQNWKVEDGCIVYEGHGYDNLCTAKQYGDFEMYVDWMLDPAGAEPDAGIYLRGTPQVQIWDTSRVNVGAQVGSGGLYNNQKHESKPSCVADNRLGEWNSFYIKMVGERVTVLLNGVKVVDNVVMENYWDRSLPIPMTDQIELQAHGSRVAFRNLYIKELPAVEPVTLSAEERKEGFELLFDGTSMHRFKGNLVDYTTDGGTIHVSPTGQGFGNLYVDDEFSDFVFRFEFKLTPGANNGVGIRCEEGKDAAYYGMEIQILDHGDPIYKGWLKDYQHHGSVYGIIPARVTDALKPVGEWNCEEIYAKGSHIRVTVNGVVVTEGDIAEAAKNGTYDGNEHPGLFNKSGAVGFLGHGSELWIKNVRVKKLTK